MFVVSCSGDSCKGDLGGRLIVNGSAEHHDYLAGIVSYFPVTCDGSAPASCSRVAHGLLLKEAMIVSVAIIAIIEKMTGFKNGSFGDLLERNNEEWSNSSKK